MLWAVWNVEVGMCAVDAQELKSLFEYLAEYISCERETYKKIVNYISFTQHMHNMQRTHRNMSSTDGTFTLWLMCRTRMC